MMKVPGGHCRARLMAPLAYRSEKSSTLLQDSSAVANGGEDRRARWSCGVAYGLPGRRIRRRR